MPVAAFRRLADWLHSDGGTIEATLAFGRDADGRRVLHGELAGELEVVCQRCLTPFRLPIRRALEAVLVETEAEAGLLPEQLEAVVVGERRGLHTIDLLEDELILALPLVPRCGDFGNVCAPAAELLVSEGPARAAGDGDGDRDGDEC